LDSLERILLGHFRIAVLRDVLDVEQLCEVFCDFGTSLAGAEKADSRSVRRTGRPYALYTEVDRIGGVDPCDRGRPDSGIMLSSFQ
jgi:hypothetical protein